MTWLALNCRFSKHLQLMNHLIFVSSAMPTFLFLKRGDVVDKMMGANPTKLQELLEELA